MNQPEHSPPANRVAIIGALTHQVRRGVSIPVLNRRNDVAGFELSVLVQVPAPFGGTQALAVEVYDHIPGAGLLAQMPDGGMLAIDAHLEWRRPAISDEDPSPRGELLVCADAIRQPDAGEQPGCDIWLAGIVSPELHFNSHRQRGNISLAHTTVAITFTIARTGRYTLLTQSMRVPVVVPVEHPHAALLLRGGNRVAVEGLIERFLAPRDKPGVARELALADAWWEIERTRLTAESGNLEQGLQRYQRRRRAAGNITRTRVIAGAVSLLEGAPRPLSEARAGAMIQP